ncbi:hypothetical protein Sa4125_41170 [Aureimonas sp. SA4125]|uniref:FAD-dependent oxidoreductase n=1 Tax=Aureimonas sp. SA4125 TaxID=2826993 RepID=UPI001CC79EEC|nr:FAD-dependent oxidoreductase [Aureimonas sp. SA4125]BDA86575.1 hypothetical protein Sa4125_41170 [Aureimonas sp. SA4125]
MARFSSLNPSLRYSTAAPAPQTEQPDGHMRAIVCIVGAGYVGLATALEPAEASVEVDVPEAQEAGFGSLSRNACHCTFAAERLPGELVDTVRRAV